MVLLTMSLSDRPYLLAGHFRCLKPFQRSYIEKYSTLAIIYLHTNQKANMAYNWNCHVGIEGILKVTCSHRHSNSGNISETVKRREAATVQQYIANTLALFRWPWVIFKVIYLLKDSPNAICCAQVKSCHALHSAVLDKISPEHSVTKLLGCSWTSCTIRGVLRLRSHATVDVSKVHEMTSNLTR